MHRVAVACLVAAVCAVNGQSDGCRADVTALEALDCSNSPSLVLFEGSKPTECQAAVKDIASAAIRLLLSASNVSGVQCLRVPVGRDPRAQSSDSMLGPEAAQAMNQSDNTFAWRILGEQTSQWLSAAVFPATTGCGSLVLVAHRKPCVHPALTPWSASVRPVPLHLLAYKRPAQEIARWVHKALAPDVSVDPLLASSRDETEPEISRDIKDSLDARLFEQASAAMFVPLLRRYAASTTGKKPRLSLSKLYPTLDHNGPLANQIMPSFHQEWSSDMRSFVELLCEWVRDDLLTVLPTRSKAGKTPIHLLISSFPGRASDEEDAADQAGAGNPQAQREQQEAQLAAEKTLVLAPYMATPTPTPIASLDDIPPVCEALLQDHPLPSVRASASSRPPMPSAFDVVREVLLTAAANEADLLHSARTAMRGDEQALKQAEALEQVWESGLEDRFGQSLWHAVASSRDNITWHSLLHHRVGFRAGMAFAPDSLGVSAADMLADRFAAMSNVIKPNPGDDPTDAVSLEQVLAATDVGILPDSRREVTDELVKRQALLSAAIAACVGGLPSNGETATAENPRQRGSPECKAWLAKQCCEAADPGKTGSDQWWAMVDRVQSRCPLVHTARVAGRMSWMRPVELLQEAVVETEWVGPTGALLCGHAQMRLLDDALSSAWNDEVNSLDGVQVELSPAIERVVVDKDKRQLPRFNGSRTDYGSVGWEALGSASGKREAADVLESLEERFGVCSDAVVQLDVQKLQAEAQAEAAGGKQPSSKPFPSSLVARLLMQMGVPVLVRNAANPVWLREMSLQAFVARLGSRRFRIGTTAFSVSNPPELPMWAMPILSAPDPMARLDAVLSGIAADATAGVPLGDVLQRALVRAHGNSEPPVSARSQPASLQQRVTAAIMGLVQPSSGTGDHASLDMDCPGIVSQGGLTAAFVPSLLIAGNSTSIKQDATARDGVEPCVHYQSAILQALEPVRKAMERHVKDKNASLATDPFALESLGISGTNRHWLWTPNAQPVYTRSDWTHAVKPSVVDLGDVGGYDAQLFGGGPLSGTNAHLHGAAINVLAAGVKRWFLWPPARTVYTAEPSRVLARRLADGLHANSTNLDSSPAGAQTDGGVPPEQGEDKGGGEEGEETDELSMEGDVGHSGVVDPIAQCTQYAGDVLMLPRAWGHGILNVVGGIGLGLETRLHPHGMLRRIIDQFPEDEWAFHLKSDGIFNFNDL